MSDEKTRPPGAMNWTCFCPSIRPMFTIGTPSWSKVNWLEYSRSARSSLRRPAAPAGDAGSSSRGRRRRVAVFNTGPQ